MQGEESAMLSLKAEVDFYRQNHTLLEAEIRTLLNDNSKLSRQIEALLAERADLVNRNVGEADQADHNDMRNQITLLTKERDSLLQLWQTSQGTIEALDTELRTYQGERYSHKHEAIRSNIPNLNDADMKFNVALEEINALEKKLEEAASKEKSITVDLKAKEDEIKSYQERGKLIEEQINDVTRHLEESKINLTLEKKNNEDLTNTLNTIKGELEASVKREAEAKSKVKEALELLDLATLQRDDACAKLITSSEELAALKASVGAACGEIESRLRTELDFVKEQYDEKVADMLAHVQALDRELVEKGLLLANTLRENKVLKKANEDLEKLHNEAMSSLDPRLAIAEQKLNAAFEELTLSERRNIQLVSEKQCLASDVTRLRDAHARDSKRWEWEAELLRGEVADLKLQIEHLQKSLVETDGMVTKLQTLLSSKSDLNHKMVSSKEEEVTALNEHIQKQIDLNKKWRQSYVDVTEQLKKRLDDLHEENKVLRQLSSPQHCVDK